MESYTLRTPNSEKQLDRLYRSEQGGIALLSPVGREGDRAIWRANRKSLATKFFAYLTPGSTVIMKPVSRTDLRISFPFCVL